MALHTTFGELITMLRAEARLSTNPAVGPDANTRYKQMLNRAYETLWNSTEWPHLRYTSPLQPLAAGQRFYDFPAGMDQTNLIEVVAWWGNEPYPLEPGIGFEEYAAFDSNTDERSDPPMKYDLRQNTPGVIQYEIWPVPASSGVNVQFKGRRRFVRLVNPGDICLIDDNVLVLTVAAEILMATDEESAKAKARAAQQAFQTVRAAHSQPQTGGISATRLGTSGPRVSFRDGKAVVVVGRG
jgi:hypothetical protein